MKIHPSCSGATQENTEAQITIVSLSAIIKLIPLSEVLDQFADLHYRYTQSWLHYKWYSKLWVRAKHLTMIPTINNYMLGTIDTNTFISKLQDLFCFIPASENPRELLKEAWNSLIAWSDQSTQRLNLLLEKNQSICFISNTNELHIEKIKLMIDNATQKTWNWKKQILGECTFQFSENLRLMTSYENKLSKWNGLIQGLVIQLFDEGRINKNIHLVSQYKQDLTKAKTLGIESSLADQFFLPVPALRQVSSLPTSSLNNSQNMACSNPALPLHNHNLADNRRAFFKKTSTNEENPTVTTDKAPLLRQ